MTTLRFLLLFYAFITFFISGGLFFKKSGQTYLTLSLFTFLFGVEILDFLYSTSEIALQYPYFYGRYYLGVGFLYGPILFIHFKVLLYDLRMQRRDLFHFIPFLLFLISAADFLVLPGISRMNYIHAHFLDRIMIYNYARAIHILMYGMIFVFLIYQNFNNLNSKKRLYSISFCGIYFITAVFISWLTAFAEGWRDFIYYYLISSSIFFLIGYILYSDPAFLKTLSHKYLESTMSNKDMKRIKKKIEAAFISQNLYLDADLTIRKLAEQINENPKNISQTLSTLVQQNFNNYVNKHRIEYAKKLLKNRDYDHYKIEGIALESGFNNKVTFYKAFKKFTNQSPSSYRKAEITSKQ